ncbi:MAG: DUF1385 domain-containing protein [Myxococcales bacterium]|nr:DUF1385 domain-containing protein [Myxococcales bacterium]
MNQPQVVGRDGVARPYIGGQALIEGVMMRSPHSYAAVVRRRSGALMVREETLPDPRVGARAWPLIRGITTLVEALKLGSRCLRFSAELYEQDMEAEEQAKKGGLAERPKGGPSTLSALSLPIIALLTHEPDAPPPAPSKEGGAGKSLFTLLTIVFAIGLFVALPQAFAAGTSRVFDLNLDVRDPRFQVITGAAKLVIVVGYMLVIRRMPEIYRVFQYHGAEHKAIHAYEAGEDLVVANARSKTTLHPRCGTTFLVMVALVSILIFSAIGPLLPQLGLGKLADNVVFFLMKLPFLPFIAAITFEIQRALARWGKGPLKLLLYPGFLVQKITTIEPDDSQLEVALAALRSALVREQSGAKSDGDSTFEGYDALRDARPAA